jgi:hypothetical protein
VLDGIIVWNFSAKTTGLMIENPANHFGRSGFSNGDQMSVVPFSQIAACRGYTDERS